LVRIFTYRQGEKTPIYVDIASFFNAEYELKYQQKTQGLVGGAIPYTALPCVPPSTKFTL
jgi:hypothetical protein